MAESQARALVDLLASYATAAPSGAGPGGGPSREILLAVDEFSAVSRRLPIWQLAEQAPALGLAVQVSAQSSPGLAADEDERYRIAAAADGGIWLLRTPHPGAGGRAGGQQEGPWTPPGGYWARRCGVIKGNCPDAAGTGGRPGPDPRPRCRPGRLHSLPRQRLRPGKAPGRRARRGGCAGRWGRAGAPWRDVGGGRDAGRAHRRRGRGRRSGADAATAAWRGGGAGATGEPGASRTASPAPPLPPGLAALLDEAFGPAP